VFNGNGRDLITISIIIKKERSSKMQRVKAHALRKFDEPKLLEELTKHRVSIPPLFTRQ